jgi:hypothetical protein
VRGITALQSGSLRFGRWRVELAKGGALRKYAIVLLLIFCCIADRAEAASPQRIGSSAAAVEMNSRFAIADFDGDQQADLATVQAGTGTSSHSRYWIRFELTSGKKQFFGVTGPAGGLQISPRDVNGDNALDLIVSTAWLHQTIAILLNDGHGNFTLANPAAFPAATDESPTACNFATLELKDDPAMVVLRPFASKCAEGGSFSAAKKVSARLLPATTPTPFCLYFFLLHGRAPPASILPA